MESEQTYSQSWYGATDDRLHFYVHTIDDKHVKIGLHLDHYGGGPSVSLTLTAADAATLAGVLRDAATTAASNGQSNTVRACPRCAGSGDFYGTPCHLCAGTGDVDEVVASEYSFAYERERLEQESSS